MEVHGTGQKVIGQSDVRGVHETAIAVNDITKGDQGAWFDGEGGAVAIKELADKVKEMIKNESPTSRPLRITKRRGMCSFDANARTPCPLPEAREDDEREEARVPRLKNG